MAKLSTKESSRTHRVLIFGPPKSGKTQLAGALAEHYNLIWIDMENGHETLFKLPKKWQERIELIHLKDTPSYPIAIETVLKIIKGKPVDICDEHGKVGCMLCKREEKPFVTVELNSLPEDTVVVFDSMTQLTTSAINNITKSEADDYKMKTDDWGNLAKLMEIFLSTIQQAHYNCIVISHEVEAETEGKKKTLVPVAGSRNSSRNSAKAFDHVIYAERKNRKHVFASSTCYSTSILTGSRTDVEMEANEEASLLQIFKPELYKKEAGSATKTKPTAVPAKTGGAAAKDILARLKTKQKK
jgi:adenosyl cobinamide kinase/adenosyl cobinamide phosphate guanylyltransferase